MSRYHDRLLRSWRWKVTRRQVFERDGYRCRNCHRSGRLECDHVVPLERGGDPYDVDNLQALCRACHIRKTAAERPPRPEPPDDVKAWRRLVDELLD